ncbi:uncharacterized protein LOC115634772 [Scaptodrosophila lebanonensis]|uniref:Uncharacterized protein LOC115634772 n=1 Tax=Drosophila lebanonensis TaxID=7225 RepID=A0A6J2UMR3_DROLE|nr:uncharacterized protein LOC115634772 [Scaptodrosophila lebanonensis]
MKAVFVITLAYLAWYVGAIKIDCEKPESVNEDHIHHCCKHPEGHNEIMEECSNKTGFPLPNPSEEAIVDLTPDHIIAGTCFGHCVMKALKFINDDKLDMEAVKKYYKERHPDDPEYVNEMISAFDHCHGKNEEGTAQFLSNPMFHSLSKNFCEPKASVIWACVIRQFFHNCPADRWSKSKECQDTLEFSKSCKDALATL